jgi:hypothetical protein
MVRKQRQYTLEIDTNAGTKLTITPPITLEFDINRKAWTSSNTSILKLYNLSEKHRSQLRRDYHDYGIAQQARTLTLKAGYDEDLKVIFRGNITVAQSVRQGVNWITTIESNDIGFALAGAYYSQTYGANISYMQIYKDMLKSLGSYGIQVGTIVDDGKKTTKQITIDGNTVSELFKLTKGNLSIDNGIANIVPMNRGLPASLPEITSENGLIGTPILQDQYVQVTMVFEPGIILNQKIQLKSKYFGNYYNAIQNADYKVNGIKHQGIISPTVSGEATTTVTLVGSAITGKIEGV